MRTRLELQALLEETLGSRNVWFKAPPNDKLKYPCIIYAFNGTKTDNANDKKYLGHKSYLLTFITDNPDSDILDKLMDLPYCTWDRQFISGNKYHNIFSIYF